LFAASQSVSSNDLSFFFAAGFLAIYFIPKTKIYIKN
jgi:hypothetical protein